MKPQQKEKMRCRKGCERNTKTKPAQLQEKRREREVKIRKKYHSLPKIHTQADEMVFHVHALSCPARVMPPSHALTCCEDTDPKQQAEHEEPLGSLTF